MKRSLAAAWLAFACSFANAAPVMLVGAAPIFLIGCERDSDLEDAAEELGDDIEDAAEDAKDEVEDAVD